MLRRLRRLARALTMLSLGVVSLAAVALLTVRFAGFPYIEQHPERVTELLQAQLGRPIELDAIETGWDGWNPKLTFHGFRLIGATPELTLSFPVVNQVIAWNSILVGDLRLVSMSLQSPQLALRLDRAGVLHIGSFEIDTSRHTNDSRLIDWVLRQRQILIHNALITWDDERRDAPQLLLDRVNFRLENRFGHHRFGLRAEPPIELASAIDVRGDLQGSLARPETVSGRLYAQFDYADVGAWREWLPSATPVSRGEGSMQLWAEFAQGAAIDIVTDVALRNVRARLADNLPELELSRLRGRIGWKSDASRLEVSTQKLELATAAGDTLEPLDAQLIQRTSAAGTAAYGHFKSGRLQLAPLRALAVSVPLPATLRERLAALLPRGTLERVVVQWDGEVAQPKSYSASARVLKLSVAPYLSWPGLEQMTGTVEATQKGGTLRLENGKSSVLVPAIFSHPLMFDSLRGEAKWRHEGSQTNVRLDNLSFANADASGKLAGEYRSLPTGPGWLDLTGTIDKADLRSTAAYLPEKLPPKMRNWLAGAIRKGSLTEGRVRLRGDLSQFPFDDEKAGQFLVTAKVQGVDLAYGERWPQITEADADLRFQGAKMMIDGKRGNISGVQLSRVHVEITDLGPAATPLRVTGEATGPTSEFLRFIKESPVAGWSNHFTADTEATGAGRLVLKLELPLADLPSSKVAGEYQFTSNRVRVAPSIPLLNDVNGKITFTEVDARSDALTTELLGGPARLTIIYGGGRMQLSGQGSADMAQVARQYSLPGNRVSGKTDWQLVADTRAGLTNWTLDSSLRGAVITLPAPLGKLADQASPTRIELRRPSAAQDTMLITRDRAQLSMQRRYVNNEPVVERAVLAFGGRGAVPDRPGFWIRGTLPSVDLDAWLDVAREARPRAPASVTPAGSGSVPASAWPAFSGADVRLNTLDVVGRRFTKVSINAGERGQDWRFDVTSDELSGAVEWQPESTTHPHGRVVARLKQFSAPKAVEADATAQAAAEADRAALEKHADWPELDIVAESFVSKAGRDLGRLEILARPQGAEWQIEKLRLSSPEGELLAGGWWRAAGRRQQTSLDATVTTSDAGKYLARYGFGNAVVGAPAKVTGQLSWAGSPQEFDYPTLSGAFRIEAGRGQFSKIQPGLGKLLGVLSLQALPRRITLDFRDIFSDGFAFDNIAGSVDIKNGVMQTDKLLLRGTSALVAISGSANLEKETQNLRVKVQPSLTAGITVGAATALLNPLVGAVVGATSLLANALPNNPLERMFSYEYSVSGTWSEPVVVKGSGSNKTTSAAPAESVER